MAKFERQEREFRKKERADRAAELHLPVYETRQQLQKVAEIVRLVPIGAGATKYTDVDGAPELQRAR
ncbi:hypothetical protein [Bradyrhizobium sp. sBnM-33]|uniref:hypothetical protein n=1 Tax=Bradyrhizobium sp. sBnM-33 TaxID=2831780 RepID=UPI001BCAA570|nr:hypothetical protein [Bradyrhizobium sp. sBnM-33]WOH46972.1 hypothetical protein RX328_22420 [Bradyrhizobium sp. sBnM-33]